MKQRQTIYLSFLIAILLLSNSTFGQQLEEGTPESVGMDARIIENLTAVLQNYVDNEQLSGAVALVARKNKIVYQKAVGQRDIEKKDPMRLDAIFRIASQTKALVSVGIMILQEEGKLLISDPVGKYISEFKDTQVAVPNQEGEYTLEKASRPITIRDLLTHTAGIGYGQGVAADLWEKAEIQGWYFAHREEPILETVKRIGKLPFDAQPGEQFVYGYNTDILGALIEVVSGETLESFLAQKILTPLGMKDTHFYLPKSKTNRLATVYSSTEKGIEKAPVEGTMVSQGAYVEGPRKSFSGGAGYLSTAKDYAIFLQMMLNKGIYNGKRILSRKSVELMTTDHLDKAKFVWNGGTGFGLGFSVIKNLGLRGDLGTVGEFGWGGAYHSTYWVDPVEELVVVYFTQLIPALNIDDHAKLRSQVYQALID
jgi:CubicO group peptidase (beta-lactamase class C family)